MLFDFDGLFDKKIAELIRVNKQGYTEAQWEDRIPKLYQKFGDTEIPALHTTPRGYYRAMDAASLVETLAEHVEKSVPVPDFLLQALAEKNCIDELLAHIKEKPALMEYAVPLLDADPRVYPVCFELLVSDGVSEAVKEHSFEICSAHADAVKKLALEAYYNGVQPLLMLELLSQVKERDAILYEVLADEFLQHPEDVATYSKLLVNYGDARAIELLMQKIEEDIPYSDFMELKYAIEALGGEYRKSRDFTGDPSYQRICASENTDLFADEKNKS